MSSRTPAKKSERHMSLESKWLIEFFQGSNAFLVQRFCDLLHFAMMSWSELFLRAGFFGRLQSLDFSGRCFLFFGKWQRNFSSLPRLTSEFVFFCPFFVVDWWVGESTQTILGDEEVVALYNTIRSTLTIFTMIIFRITRSLTSNVMEYLAGWWQTTMGN